MICSSNPLQYVTGGNTARDMIPLRSSYEEENTEKILTNMRIGISSFDNINPIISQNRDVINLSTIIYEPLMSLTEDYKLEMRLAKECSKID